jgi:uncharacterized membrane protein YqjE
MSEKSGHPALRLVGEIVNDLQGIIRAELSLATLEIRAEAAKLRQAAIFCGIAALVGALGLGWLLFAFIQMLAMVVALWAAALTVSVVALVGAALLAVIGIRRAKEVRAPFSKTTASMREIVQWKPTSEL